MTDERRDELSTADLAGQRPTTPERTDDRVEDADLDSRRETLTDDRAVDTDADGRADTMAEGPVDTGRADTAAEGPTDTTADGRGDTVAEMRPEERVDDAGGLAAGADRSLADDGVADGTGAAAPAGSTTGPLLASADAEGFRARWTDVQTGFVDSPRQAVERADALVAEVMQHLAKTFADERNGLERQWDRGGEVSTDDLRSAFQRYRSFFERLLST
ncbi:MAG TPA: hypothetical protein VGC06_04865 [Actinomycetes bacterium]